MKTIPIPIVFFIIITGTWLIHILSFIWRFAIGFEGMLRGFFIAAILASGIVFSLIRRSVFRYVVAICIPGIPYSIAVYQDVFCRNVSLVDNLLHGIPLIIILTPLTIFFLKDEKVKNYYESRE